MRRISRLFRPSSELLYGVFHALLWLLLALQVTTGVVRPLAAVFTGAAPVVVQ